MRHAPPPPKVGDKFRMAGPRTKWLYHVRAIVDAEQHKGRWMYRVVMRTWNHPRGWRYVIETQAGFQVGLFVPDRGPRIKQPRKERHP